MCSSKKNVCCGQHGNSCCNSKVHVEIRAAEGGDDSKDLVKIQSAMYIKSLERRGL